MKETVAMTYSDIVGNLLLALVSNKVEMNSIPFYLVNKYTELLGDKFSEYKMNYCFEDNMFEENKFFEDNKKYIRRNDKNRTIDIVETLNEDYLYFFFRAGIPFDAYKVLDDKSTLIELLQFYKLELEEEHKKEIINLKNKILKLVMEEHDEDNIQGSD